MHFLLYKILLIIILSVSACFGNASNTSAKLCKNSVESSLLDQQISFINKLKRFNSPTQKIDLIKIEIFDDYFIIETVHHKKSDSAMYAKDTVYQTKVFFNVERLKQASLVPINENEFIEHTLDEDILYDLKIANIYLFFIYNNLPVKILENYLEKIFLQPKIFPINEKSFPFTVMVPNNDDTQAFYPHTPSPIFIERCNTRQSLEYVRQRMKKIYGDNVQFFSFDSKTFSTEDFNGQVNSPISFAFPQTTEDLICAIIHSNLRIINLPAPKYTKNSFLDLLLDFDEIYIDADGNHRLTEIGFYNLEYYFNLPLEITISLKE